MTLRDLLSRLASEGLVDPALLDPASPAAARAAEVLAPYSRDAMRLQRAGSSTSVWVGAALLAWFLVASELVEVVPIAALLGAAALGLAGALARARPTLVTLQLLWIAVISGQSLVLFVVEEVVNSTTALSLAALALQGVTLALIPNLAVSVASASIAVFALTALVAEYTDATWAGGGLGLALGAITVALWIHEAALLPRLGRYWQAAAYALPAALFAPMLLGLEDRSGESAALLSAGWCALSVWLIGQASRETPALAGGARLLGWGAVALAAIVGHRAPGLGAGVALLLLSRLRGGPALQTLGLVAIGGYLFLWYYDLDTSLLAKSAAACGNGVVFLLAAGALRRGARRAREAEAFPLAARLSAMRWLLAALGLALAIPAYVVVRKEQIIAAQETVLLPLRPVDPRSLIQGDYMRLAYAITRDLPDLDTLPDRGALVITLDAHRVGRFVRVDDGRPLAPGEHRLRYAKREREVSFGAESLLFPEGQGAALERAFYGELALAPGGDSVLLGVRDEQRRPIGPRPHDPRP